MVAWVGVFGGGVEGLGQLGEVWIYWRWVGTVLSWLWRMNTRGQMGCCGPCGIVDKSEASHEWTMNPQVYAYMACNFVLPEMGVSGCKCSGWELTHPPHTWLTWGTLRLLWLWSSFVLKGGHIYKQYQVGDYLMLNDLPRTKTRENTAISHPNTYRKQGCGEAAGPLLRWRGGTLLLNHYSRGCHASRVFLGGVSMCKMCVSVTFMRKKWPFILYEHPIDKV